MSNEKIRDGKDLTVADRSADTKDDILNRTYAKMVEDTIGRGKVRSAHPTDRVCASTTAQAKI